MRHVSSLLSSLSRSSSLSLAVLCRLQGCYIKIYIECHQGRSQFHSWNIELITRDTRIEFMYRKLKNFEYAKKKKCRRQVDHIDTDHPIIRMFRFFC